MPFGLVFKVILTSSQLASALVTNIPTSLEASFVLAEEETGRQAACQTQIADNLADPDSDGLVNMYESFFKTDPCLADSDVDGYIDGLEIKHGFNPTSSDIVKIDTQDADQDGLVDIKEVEFISNPLSPDTDSDGLGDWQEIKWQTDLKSPDTDGDGQLDGEEVRNFQDPLGTGQLTKEIKIDLAKQELSYLAGGQVLGTFIISSGRPGMATPKGEFKIESKNPRAYSKTYGLYMPYWQAFTPGGKYGLHELPEWPNGYKEGANHLGQPVSHGCVRLGEGDAKALYDFADIGTKVVIK